MITPFKLTATGRRINVGNPQVSAIDLLDEAWALSQINRFTGHALRPYCVAEHSLLVCEIVEREFGLPAMARLAALHHDGHEAIVGDCASPDKQVLGAAWELYELGWQRAVQGRWGITLAAQKWAGPIKRADLMALATERRDLMPAHPDPWDVLDGIEPIGWVRLHAPERRAHDWEFWRDRFMDEHYSLMEALEA